MLIVFLGKVGLGSTNNSLEITVILALDILEGKDSRGLLVDDGTKTGFTLDNNVGDTHLATEGRQENDEFDRVNIMSDDDEVGLLGLDKSDNMVETKLDKQWLLVLLLFLVGSGSRSSRHKTGLLLLFALRAILVKELEQLNGRVLVESVVELSDGGRHLEALVQDDLLALKANILGPFDEAGQVCLRANVLTNAKIFGGGLEERVLLGLGDLASTKRSGSWLSAGTRFRFRGHFDES